MKGLFLSAVILVLALVANGRVEAFRGTRHLTEDAKCQNIPNTDECRPSDDMLIGAVEKAADEELKELWLAERVCESTKEEDKCRANDACLWVELGCFCGFKAIAENQQECSGYPVPVDKEGQIQCPLLSNSEQDCTANELCAWTPGICFAKNMEVRDPLPIEQRPKVCRLLVMPDDCAAIQDKETCNGTKGKCEWVAADPSGVEDPADSCPALAEAEREGLIQPAPKQDAPFEFCGFTQSNRLELIFQDTKMIKKLRKAEKSCRGTC